MAVVGLSNISDRCLLVLCSNNTSDWLLESISDEAVGKDAVLAESFTWHPVFLVVGNVRNQMFMLHGQDMAMRAFRLV